MNSQEWTARGSARQHEHWPRLPDVKLREVAAEIRREVLRQVDEPLRVATAWLRRGLPDGH